MAQQTTLVVERVQLAVARSQTKVLGLYLQETREYIFLNCCDWISFEGNRSFAVAIATLNSVAQK